MVHTVVCRMTMKLASKAGVGGRTKTPFTAPAARISPLLARPTIFDNIEVVPGFQVLGLAGWQVGCGEGLQSYPYPHALVAFERCVLVHEHAAEALYIHANGSSLLSPWFWDELKVLNCCTIAGEYFRRSPQCCSC